MRIGSGDCNMHAIQHECAMRCIQPHVVHVNPCTLPLPLPLPMNPIACNMKRADGCKHHLYPARNNKNVLSFLSFTRQNQQNQCIASQPQRVGGGSAIRVLNFSRQLLLYRAARATVVLSRENIPQAIFLRAEGASSTPADGTIVDKEDIAHAGFAIGLDIGEAGISVAIDLTGMMWCLAVLSTPSKGDLFAPLEVAEDFLAEL